MKLSSKSLLSAMFVGVLQIFSSNNAQAKPAPQGPQCYCWEISPITKNGFWADWGALSGQCSALGNNQWHIDKRHFDSDVSVCFVACVEAYAQPTAPHTESANCKP